MFLFLFDYTMPCKCCVPLCNSNYATSVNNGEAKIPVYRFPQDEAEKDRWIYAIPRVDLCKLLEKNSVVVVCRKHWPDNWKTYTYRGKIRPSAFGTTVNFYRCK